MRCTSGCPVLAVFSIRTSLGCVTPPSVVVMQAIEDWECHGQTVCLGRSRHRLFLPKALIGELGSRSPTPPSFVPEETVGSSGTPITGRGQSADTV